mmetsp:Transcript_18872/g.54400  ORF Transcript_18872/g.54400 Transcript_18872/m.54400 type:complete len:412 (+) Transcript_18872:115-1350(+)|eukprot:CAMPEP_0181031098 /NCGR_PEP_ID=MMETSP1070-20121207/6059_1 /TAXON_ID=265543 /ORGANISM="Minutocellus polymorphus, Strain NH13" /LENGTH=411 /DNA_ID=CAMNT_0023108469 /DNA_START=105 /DNA_END=1340 /DNA_ORIENTATION=+
MMKISPSQLLMLAILAGSASAAKIAANDNRADDEFFSKAFGLVQVQSDHDASQWRDFLSDGPLPESVEDLIDDEQDNFVDGKKVEARTHNKKKDNKNRKLWYDPWSQHKRGWFAIDTDGDRALEVKSKNDEECITIGEGIGHDGWKFGITHGHVPNTTTTDTFLQLFEEWSPYMPVYKYFQGAKKLCIGEKSKENIAYLYIITDAGCYYLVGKPDSGRDDHLPKLKIRDQDNGWRRQRKLRKKEVTADKKQGAEGRELWSASDYNDHYDKTTGKYVVVRFRDGPGITNTYWQIWQNGFAKTSPNARWFFVPNAGGPKPNHPIEPDTDDIEAGICKATGGTVEYTICKCQTKDFFNTCSVDLTVCNTPKNKACTFCANPGSPKLNCYCKCPATMCFSEGAGCMPCPIPAPLQ